MSEPLKIYERYSGKMVENPSPELVEAAKRALRAERDSGRPMIDFAAPRLEVSPFDPSYSEPTSPHGIPVYRIENPNYRTYP